MTAIWLEQRLKSPLANRAMPITPSLQASRYSFYSESFKRQESIVRTLSELELRVPSRCFLRFSGLHFSLGLFKNDGPR